MINLNLKKKEAVAFFGNQSKIAEILGTTQGSVSQWGDIVPINVAFRLAFIAKMPQYRRKGKLNYELIIT